jgi:hypothetical protein
MKMEVRAFDVMYKKLLRFSSLCLFVSVAALPGCGGSSQQASEQAAMREQVKIVRQQQQRSQEKRQLNDYNAPEK